MKNISISEVIKIVIRFKWIFILSLTITLSSYFYFFKPGQTLYNTESRLYWNHNQYIHLNTNVMNYIDSIYHNCVDNPTEHNRISSPTQNIICAEITVDNPDNAVNSLALYIEQLNNYLQTNIINNFEYLTHYIDSSVSTNVITFVDIEDISLVSSNIPVDIYNKEVCRYLFLQIQLFYIQLYSNLIMRDYVFASDFLLQKINNEFLSPNTDLNNPICRLNMEQQVVFQLKQVYNKILIEQEFYNSNFNNGNFNDAIANLSNRYVYLHAQAINRTITDLISNLKHDPTLIVIEKAHIVYPAIGTSKIMLIIGCIIFSFCFPLIFIMVFINPNAHEENNSSIWNKTRGNKDGSCRK
ncbi:MAG: hypothetical protein ACRDDZ_01070 [Marinifilaceae bacterium]